MRVHVTAVWRPNDLKRWTVAVGFRHPVDDDTYSNLSTVCGSSTGSDISVSKRRGMFPCSVCTNQTQDVLYYSQLEENVLYSLSLHCLSAAVCVAMPVWLKLCVLWFMFNPIKSDTLLTVLCLQSAISVRLLEAVELPGCLRNASKQNPQHSCMVMDISASYLFLGLTSMGDFVAFIHNSQGSVFHKRSRPMSWSVTTEVFQFICKKWKNSY